jgi:hypothetical protein
MNSLDVSYILRLSVEDRGWEKVRGLAAQAPIACSLHGHVEVVVVLHRKFREGAFSRTTYAHVLDQFDTDCDNNAYRWLPVSPAVIERVAKAYRTLPASVFLHSSDALHLASASENRFRDIYSNNQRLIGSAGHFALKGLDVL